jgi:hypothetical protein
MKQEDIIRMAREAGLIVDANQSGFDSVERFAALVAAAATEAANARANTSWALMCKKMVAAEKEACAKVCDVLSDKHGFEGCYADECAAAIRARGQT